METKEKKEKRIQQRYQKLYGEVTDYREVSRHLSEIKNDPDIDSLRSMFCNEYLYNICAGYAKYPDKETDEAIAARQLFIHNVSLLPESSDYYFFKAAASFYKHNYTQCIRYLKMDIDEWIKEAKEKLNERTWADVYLDTFKNAYPGFWIKLAELLKSGPCEEEVYDLCFLMDKYYKCSTDDEMIDLLLPFSAEHSNLIIPKELLGFSYIGKKMWNNALACLEQIVDKSVLFYDSDIYFQLGYCYGNLHNFQQEEIWYRKCVDADPGYPFAMNNLGYCYYRQKKYQKAKEILEKCLEKRKDLPNASNNYVRVLLATGQYEDAHKFIKNNKVSSGLEKRVKQYSAVNRKDFQVEDDISRDEEEESEGKTPDFGIKRQQFSSEKILEDELTARIDAGFEVFGKRLKIYKRAGDFYGRQYPIANGKWRLDLLCEDSEKNLYVIELKKDKGYDDPYAQIINYIEWIKKNRCKENKEVFGIICLNSPTRDLAEKVRNDERVKLYEYRITYSEIK